MIEYLLRQKLYFGANVQHSKRIFSSFLKRNTYYVFVDGSFRNGVGVGFGAVILKNGKIIQQIVGNFQDVPLALQSLGEFTAVIKGVEWCEKKNAKRIVVFYDCEGIKHLAKQWKPHNYKSSLQAPYMDYHKFMQPRIHNGSRVVLAKVKAHSCDFMNNWADRLAKMGLYRLTTAQIRKEVGLPRQTGKHLLRMVERIESNPLEVLYA